MADRKWNRELDTNGLLCPLPVLRVRKALKQMQSGDILRLLVNDPAAVVDIPHYCSETGNKILEAKVNNNNQIYLILKT